MHTSRINMSATQSSVKKLLFIFPSQKREIFVTYIEHVQYIFLSFLHRSSKKFFVHETFGAHIGRANVYAHVFSEFLNISKIVFQSRCKCPHVHLAIIPRTPTQYCLFEEGRRLCYLVHESCVHGNPTRQHLT